ncbi:hypothetical protein [Sinorhizobium alkalisoli]|uniref:Uncharacterized protein n=1 Tax=Sinorhizobium alkalisoli TaxID=1752398 RepID=A0A1E3V6Y0_9HYPH|nr:hypothetical protein [Sinorhizobium alkalisoli]ODR88861.1 hypothetical protein A8M32_20445 [Sinorhizobium alkalisoli]
MQNGGYIAELGSVANVTRDFLDQEAVLALLVGTLVGLLAYFMVSKLIGSSRSTTTIFHETLPVAQMTFEGEWWLDHAEIISASRPEITLLPRAGPDHRRCGFEHSASPQTTK